MKRSGKRLAPTATIAVAMMLIASWATAQMPDPPREDILKHGRPLIERGPGALENMVGIASEGMPFPDRRNGGMAFRMPFAPPMITSGTLPLPTDLLQFAEREFPDLRLDLERNFGRMPPAEAMEAVMFLRRMQDLQVDDPEAFSTEKNIRQLESRAEALASALRKQNGVEKNTLRKQLEGVLGELFDHREKRRERDAQSIETELKRIRGILEQRQRNRDAIIQKRLRALTGEEDGLEW